MTLRSGRTQQAIVAYEAAKARGEHVHLWSFASTECSISCGERINTIRYPQPNRLDLAHPKEGAPS